MNIINSQRETRQVQSLSQHAASWNQLHNNVNSLDMTTDRHDWTSVGSHIHVSETHSSIIIIIIKQENDYSDVRQL